MPQDAKENPLRDFQQAMHSGDMEAVIERYGIPALLEFLQHYVNPLVQWSRGRFWPYIGYDPNTPNSHKAWAAMDSCIKAAPLTLLLELHTLNISRLSHAIRIGMIKQLTLATKEDLEELTPEHHKELRGFTLYQLRPMVTKSPHLEALQHQAATLGYLAMATLKIPGAENPRDSGFHTQDANLCKAIDEYHEALRSAN